tara:strand:+ start:30 stop:200 length:171 start_codon:yes stop_codon:yes gene_type:complete
MFFVSEEFLHKYEAGEAFSQTIDEAVPEGAELFEGEYLSKSDFHDSQKGGSKNDKL